MLKLCMFCTIEGLSFIGPCYCRVNYDAKLLPILLSFVVFCHLHLSFVILYFRRYTEVSYKILAWEKYSEHVWNILISFIWVPVLSDLTAKKAVLSSLADLRKRGSVSVFISGLGQKPVSIIEPILSLLNSPSLNWAETRELWCYNRFPLVSAVNGDSNAIAGSNWVGLTGILVFRTVGLAEIPAVARKLSQSGFS